MPEPSGGLWEQHRDGSTYIAEPRTDGRMFVRHVDLENRVVGDAFQIGTDGSFGIRSMALAGDVLFATSLADYGEDFTRADLATTPVSTSVTNYQLVNLRNLMVIPKARRLFFGIYEDSFPIASLRATPLTPNGSIENIGMPVGDRGLRATTLRAGGLWASVTSLDNDGPETIWRMDIVQSPGWQIVTCVPCVGSVPFIEAIRDRFVDRVLCSISGCEFSGGPGSLLRFIDPATEAESDVLVGFQQSSLRVVPVPPSDHPGLSAVEQGGMTLSSAF